jgi:small-conductance mechanosensitive channel
MPFRSAARRPREQFVSRRKALARIKQTFDDKGIQFALPTVQVAGGEETAPAAARHVIEWLNPDKPVAE